MSRFVLSLIFIISALVIFFVPTRSKLDSIQPLTVERDDLHNALENVKKIQVKRDALQANFNSFPPAALDRLQKILPSHVDNVHLAIDINEMANRYGMILRNIDIRASTEGVTSDSNRDALVNAAQNSLEELNFRFTVGGTYESLKLLLADLARSVRVVDVRSLTFVSTDNNSYDFDIELKTYWLGGTGQ